MLTDAGPIMSMDFTGSCPWMEVLSWKVRKNPEIVDNRTDLQ